MGELCDYDQYFMTGTWYNSAINEERCFQTHSSHENCRIHFRIIVFWIRSLLSCNKETNDAYDGTMGEKLSASLSSCTESIPVAVQCVIMNFTNATTMCKPFIH